jgi:hypothetical protein
MSGLRAIDATENHRDAILEPPVAFFLAGPASEAYCGGGEQNRSAHFAGGRLTARIPKLNNDYTIVFWCWNGMPTDAREVAGWMFSRGRDWGLDAHSEHLGLGGADNHPGKLILQRGDEVIAAGKTNLERWQWYQVALVRSGDTIKVFLNDADEPEISVSAKGDFPSDYQEIFFGGRSDRKMNWEGRLDEIAVFSRALSKEELSQLMSP